MGFLETRAREWLDYGWKKGNELLSGGAIPYDDWWAKMQQAAAEFWGFPSNGRLAVDLVRPIYWEQHDRHVFRWQGNSALWGQKPTPSMLIENGGVHSDPPQDLAKKYEGYIISNLAKERK